jgi:tetratricopeptide (TPR) repeat protein
MGKMPSSWRKMSLGERTIVTELERRQNTLEPTKSRRWYDRFYTIVLAIGKYVGIPGIIIAAIAPSQKLITAWVEYENKMLIETVYLDYISTLLKEGSFDRADILIQTLEKHKDFDARLQYYKAKTLVTIAIQQGKQYMTAFDTASILTEIASRRTLFFPTVGGTDDLIDLNFALVDIQIQQQKYADALSKIQHLSKDTQLEKSPLLIPNAEYRLGTIGVLRYEIPEAKTHLTKSIDMATKINQKLLVANATFQLAKAYQFDGDGSTALTFYQEAVKYYEELSDKFDMLRAFNNIAMINFDQGNNDTARSFYNREQNLARELGDELGYARATVNIALLEKSEKHYSAAIRLAMDALGVFKQQANSLGIITSANILANVYEITGNREEAVAYAKLNLDTSLGLRELRGVESACGTLSNIYADSNDDGEMIFVSLCAAALIKELHTQNIPAQKADYDIFVSRIKAALTNNPNDSAVLDKSERRVKELFIQLNVDPDILSKEVALLQR